MDEQSVALIILKYLVSMVRIDEQSPLAILEERGPYTLEPNGMFDPVVPITQEVAFRVPNGDYTESEFRERFLFPCARALFETFEGMPEKQFVIPPSVNIRGGEIAYNDHIIVRAELYTLLAGPVWSLRCTLI